MKSWQTKLIHSDATVPQEYRSLVTPVYRGSTTVFSSSRIAQDNWDQLHAGYTYGLYGTPTNLELAARICELESGRYTLLTPGGQAALTLVNFALLSAGDHVLLPYSIYGPHALLMTRLLTRVGIAVTFYDPRIGIAIADSIGEHTRLVWVESPGWVTMEVQDVPAIAQAAHARGARVAVDNTWAAGVFFDAIAHGADITVQALTKYIGGHSDIMLGSVTVNDDALYRELGSAQQVLGQATSPDDCSLALRGLQTLAVRLSQIERSALTIASWLTKRPEVELTLHPALPSCEGHELWRRDFTGSSGVFSVVFKPGPTKDQLYSFADALKLFKIGHGWGGTTSLAMTYDFTGPEDRRGYGYRLMRFNIGLESTDDLILDLDQALIELARQ